MNCWDMNHCQVLNVLTTDNVDPEAMPAASSPFSVDRSEQNAVGSFRKGKRMKLEHEPAGRVCKDLN